MCNREIEITACGAIESGTSLIAKYTTSLFHALNHKLLSVMKKNAGPYVIN